MTTGKVRRPLRATLAAICALSLTGSMALPLIAVAQTGEEAGSDQAAWQVAEISEPTDTIAAPAEKGNEPVDTDAPTAVAPDDQGVDGGVETDGPVAADDLLDADETTAPDAEDEATVAPATPATDEQAAGMATEERDADAARPEAEALAQLVEAAPCESDADEAVDADDASDIVALSLVLRLPAEYAVDEADAKKAFVSLPSGMSLDQAKRDGALIASGADGDFFFTLGTTSAVPAGSVYPGVDGYVFDGWVDTSTGAPLAGSTLITEAYDQKEFVTTWKKVGSNFAFYNETYAFGLNGSIAAGGTLAGPNIPADASLRVVQGEASQEAISAIFEYIIGVNKLDIGPDHIAICDISLYANNVQVHDGFGAMTLSFCPFGGFEDGTIVRVWHRHADGSITHEDITAANGLATIEVTDLSTFAFADLGAPAPTPPSTTQPPASSEGDNGGEGDGKQPATGGEGDGGTQSGVQTNAKETRTVVVKSGLAPTGDDTSMLLGSTMALLTCALLTGGVALLMGGRKRPGAHQR